MPIRVTRRRAKVILATVTAATAAAGAAVVGSGWLDNDTSVPFVRLSAPASGATVSGATVTVSAKSGDNVGVSGVQFKLDGANIGAEDTSAPYSISWDSTATANGSRAVTAVARDAAANTKTSSTRTVTVNNVGTSANLWVDRNGGTCVDSATPITYVDADACEIGAGIAACDASDTLIIKADLTYSGTTVTSAKSSPGCTATAENGVQTEQWFITDAAWITLENITVDVGTAANGISITGGNNITLRDVNLHGDNPSFSIGGGVDDFSWIGGELGEQGEVGAPRACGTHNEPVEIAGVSAANKNNDVLIDGVTFYPQASGTTGCGGDVFHLEMIRVDNFVDGWTVKNSTFVDGDGSNTATMFITDQAQVAGSDPVNGTVQNNFFGTNDAFFSIDIHGNAAGALSTLKLGYNTFKVGLTTFGAGATITGNLGPHASAIIGCAATYTKNVWQDSSSTVCGSDTWVSGTRGQTGNLGIGSDFRLTVGSPAIDTAETGGYCTSTLGSVDHDGLTRPINTVCDAGADEYGN